MTFKQCSSCDAQLPAQDFHKNKNSIDGYLYTCKNCAKAKRRISVKSKGRDYINQYTSKRRIERKLWAINYLGGCCSKCGKIFPSYVYDFHHLDPRTKDEGIAMKILLSEDKLKLELDKCVLVCANCHREIHWGISQ